jgi:hypothetical protein
MIRKYSLFCKIIRIKTSSQSIFASFMEQFKPHLEVCPFCKSKGNCHPSASYDRHLVDFIRGFVSDSSTIRILRVKCSSCHRTHAILPDVIIPYASYSLFFILRVIGEYYAHLQSVDALCNKFSISHSLLYKWLRTFQEHKALWLSALNDSLTSCRDFITILCNLMTFSSFLEDYFLLTGTSFLQPRAHSKAHSHLP